jgi:hypothetical protein
MKTDPDPDIDIPIIIDYIKSDMGKDNAIRKAYGGGMPYSGYLIDCDGKILEAHNWAWADTTQSWPMKVESFENLIASLNKYLEGPSTYYNIDAGSVSTENTQYEVVGENEKKDEVSGNKTPDSSMDSGIVCEEDLGYVIGKGPQLDDGHIGWQNSECGSCHEVPLPRHDATEYKQCIVCHGANGL